MPDRARRSELTALLALLAGALAIGSSGIFVRLSETGPTATAFWRGCLALPPLALWALLERRAARAAGRAPASLRDPQFFWAGVFFAGDLGRAFPPWPGTARGAILRPPNPEIRPSPQVLQRTADRDADWEAAD